MTHSRILFVSLFLVACSSSSSQAPSSTADGGDGQPGPTPGADASPGDDAGSSDAATPAPTACASTGATLGVAKCEAPDLAGGDVPTGCTPTVDGALHASEWADAACFTVGADDMRVYVKASGDAFYMATIGNPTCGCGMQFNFLPSAGTTIGADEFTIAVVDDPFETNGDRANLQIAGGKYVTGATPPPGIVTACPGGQPMPVPYEWKIPLAALAITPGTAHDFRLAIVHAGASWPSGLTTNANHVPDDPSTWGTLTSSKRWK